MKAFSSLIVALSLNSVASFGVKEPVSTLLQKHVSDIARLKEETQSIVGSIDAAPYNNDVFYLRYCLEDKGIDELKETLTWRQGPGKAIQAHIMSAGITCESLPACMRSHPWSRRSLPISGY